MARITSPSGPVQPPQKARSIGAAAWTCVARSTPRTKHRTKPITLRIAPSYVMLWVAGEKMVRRRTRSPALLRWSPRALVACPQDHFDISKRPADYACNDRLSIGGGDSVRRVFPIPPPWGLFSGKTHWYRTRTATLSMRAGSWPRLRGETARGGVLPAQALLG